MRLLLLQSGALGDTVLAARLGMSLGASLGAKSVSIVARSRIVLWMKRHRIVQEAMLQDNSPLASLYKPSFGDPSAQEFLRRFDLVLSLLGNPAAPVSDRLRSLTSSPCVCVDPCVKRETLEVGLHITDQWLSDFWSQGPLFARNERHPLEVRVPRGEDSFARLRVRTAAPSDSRIVLCHPGSGGLAKCCPLESLIALIHRCRDASFHPAWMIGPDEIERFGTEYAMRLGDVAPVVYEEDVSNGADLVACADAYIGNDAGMTHVAALTGVPTIALFGPTDPRVWRPLGVNVRVVRFPSAGESAAMWAENALADVHVLLSP